MRLSYVLLLAAAALVATTDTTTALSGARLSKPYTANAVDATNAHESIENDRRFQRAHKSDDVVDDDDEEERMFSGWAEKAKAAMAAAKLAGKSTDDMAEVLTTLGKGEVDALFNQGKSQLMKAFPDFTPGMALDDFDKMIRSANVPQGERDVLIVGYSKYLALNGHI